PGSVLAGWGARPIRRAPESARKLPGWVPTIAIPLAILVAGTIAHVLWRHGYYGEWLPNTARVKAGFSALRLERGLDYVLSFALAVPVVLVVLPVALLGALGARGRQSPRLALAAALVIAGAAGYVIDVGG